MVALKSGIPASVKNYKTLSLTHKSGGPDTTDGTSFATSSQTFTSGALIYIACNHTRTGAVPSATTSVTGASISNPQLIGSITFDTVATARERLEVWTALGTGSAGAVTFSYGAETQTGHLRSFEEITNADTSRGLNGVLAAFGSGQGDAGTAYSLNVTTLTAADTGTRCIAAWAHDTSATFTPKATWTETADLALGTPTAQMEVQYLFSSQDLVATATPSTGTPDWAGIAVQVAAARG